LSDSDQLHLFATGNVTEFERSVITEKGIGETPVTAVIEDPKAAARVAAEFSPVRQALSPRRRWIVDREAREASPMPSPKPHACIKDHSVLLKSRHSNL
jgi:hypothetical protein